jgi:transcription factor C subunit 6
VHETLDKRPAGCLTKVQLLQLLLTNLASLLLTSYTGTPRRAARAKQRKSYRVEDEYSFLDDEAGSVASRVQTPDEGEEPQEEEDDFMPDAEEEPEEELDDDEIVATSESDDNDYSEPERPATPELNIREVDASHTPDVRGDGKHQRELAAKIKLSNKKVKVPIQITRGGGTAAKAVASTPLRTRGVADFTKVGGQEVRLKDLFGPRSEDLNPILNTRDFWKRQETLPVRKSKTWPSTLRRSFFESAEGRAKDISTTRSWYANSGREVFAKGQKSTSLSAEEAMGYLTNDGAESLNVLCGPVDNPQVYTLKKLSYLSVAEPFKQKEGRRGWLFNLGSRIQDAQWAPNEDGNTQYLAVAVEQKAATESQPKPMENPKAPAFSATIPFPASIQIWAFDANEIGELDVSQQPRLQLVICTKWGAPKQFRWCPIQANAEKDKAEDQDDVHIGLLAGIWSDGRVRILEVSCPRPAIESSETQYFHITQAAFDVDFPQTIPSCLRWLSGTTLAVATAIGTLAIWTLSRPGTFTSAQVTKRSPRPWFYQQISDTFILTLSSGWPSQPHFISITTADGFARLYDIRTPNADTTASIRGRTLCLTQDWHEQTQSFIAPDEHYMLKHNPIRRFYHNLYTMRAESSITRCASSPVHPGILIGGADGRVESSNPVGRICNYKVMPWQQTWIAHEYRGPVSNLVPSQPKDVEMNDGGPVTAPKFSSTVPQSFLDQPLARITEGYKALQPGIQHSITSKKVANPEVGKGITIYEERSAVTALAWNPNLKFGGWAVAGMGSGLLRVEDILV